MKAKNLVAFVSIIALILIVSIHFSERGLLSNTLSLFNPIAHADAGPGPGAGGDGPSGDGGGVGPGAPGGPGPGASGGEGTDGNTGDTPDYGGSNEPIGPVGNPDPFCVNQVTPIYSSPNCPGQVHTVNHYFMACKDGTQIDEGLIDGGWTGTCQPVCTWSANSKSCSTLTGYSSYTGTATFEYSSCDATSVRNMNLSGCVAPVYGVCNNTAAHNCTTGNVSGLSGNATSGWTWYCEGTPNTARSSLCSYTPPVPVSTPAVFCPLPPTGWVGTLRSGDSITAWQAPSAATCVSETRTCATDGKLSGTYGYAGCNVTSAPVVTPVQQTPATPASPANPASPATPAVVWTNYCTGYDLVPPPLVPHPWQWWAYDNTPPPAPKNWKYVGPGNMQPGCVEPQAVAPLDCITPWGTAVADGVSVPAFLRASEISPATCSRQDRMCSNNGLSGTYTNQNCNVTYPIIDSFDVSPRRVSPVSPNNKVFVSWSTTDVTSCSITKNGAFWKSGTASSGTQDAVSTRTRYTITCDSLPAQSVWVNTNPNFNEY